MVMKFIDEIMDAIGIVDEVDEEEEAPRKPKEEKKAPKPAAAPKAAKVEEDEDDEPKLSTKEKITSLFSHKASRAEAAPAPKAEEPAEEKSESKRKPLVFNFNKNKDVAEPTVVPAEKRPAPAAPKAAPRRPSMPVSLGEVNLQMLEPTCFDDSQKVADSLHNNQPVIVNFENTDPIVAKRMTDFISGVIYALQGNMKKIGRDILVCAPKNVDIDSGLGFDNRGDN